MANGQVFKPSGNYSTPTIESQVTLQTEQALRIFRRCFEGAGRSLFSIDVITRVLAQGNKQFNHGEVMDAINTMLTKVQKDIKDSTARFEAMLKANGQESAQARYQAAETLTFSISTPEILRFAQILVSFDEMIQKFDTAWLVQLIDTQKAQAFRGEQQRMMMRIVGKLQQQATLARRKARTEASVEAMAELNEVLTEDASEKRSLAEAAKVASETGGDLEENIG